MMQLQRWNTIFNIGGDIMRPAFNLEPNYRVTLPKRRVEWRTRDSIGYTDGLTMMEGTGAGVCGQALGRRLSISRKIYFLRLSCMLS
jgi:hypothetical protein